MIDIIEDYKRTAIPELPSLDGWQNMPINETNETLVTLSSLGIPSASFYAGLHDFSPYEEGQLKGAYNEVYVRKGFGQALLEAQDMLPENLSLVGLDGYRARQLQAALYDYYYTKLEAVQPIWSDEQLATETQKFVSLPSQSQSAPAPHITGGALDCWLLEIPEGMSRRSSLDEILVHSAWLSAGTVFDHGGSKANLRYLEDHDDVPRPDLARCNRRLFYWLMKSVGVELYSEEYWHLSKGNQWGAKLTGEKAAIYGEAQSPEEQQQTQGFKIATHIPLGEIIAPPTN